MLRHQQRMHRARENSFNLAQKANDVLLPTYNALSDPYLAGYFDNPLLKRHLKETGVIKRKRRLSCKLGKGSPQAKSRNALTERGGIGGLGGEQRSKSLAKSVNYFKNQVKLPALEQLLQEERAGIASAGGSRRGVYRSNNHPHASFLQERI